MPLPPLLRFTLYLGLVLDPICGSVRVKLDD